MTTAEAIMWVLFAHYIGDWALQPQWIGMSKGKYWYVMLSHCMVYTGIVAIAFKYVGVPDLVRTCAIIFVIHWAVDAWKCRETKEFPTWHLYVDQFIHIALLITWLFAAGIK